MYPYKMHLIVPSEVRAANAGKRLYEVRGKYSKAAAHRPFLPSYAAAKQWITEQITENGNAIGAGKAGARDCQRPPV